MIGSYPVDPRIVPGGVAAVAHYLVKGLARLPDLDLHVVCCQADVRRDETTRRDGATVHFLTHNDRFSQLTQAYLPRRKVQRTLRAIAPDLVHAQGLGLPAATALDSGRPHAVTVHGITWKEASLHYPSRIRELRGRLRARHDYRQIAKVRNVFIISGYAARMLPPEGRYRRFVINNPVGDRIFQIRNAPDRPHVLVVGGLRPRKDPLTAVRVMEKVLRKVPDATMHLLGPPSNTPFDAEVEDFVRERGLTGKVRLLGLVPDHVLWEEYERASLLLMTSLEETAPVALGEACAVGLPAVGTDAGGIPDMIRNDETGYVRPVGDIAGLAERVVAILEDPQLRTRLAAAAREVGRAEFALDAIARKTHAAYQEILRSGD
jgi:1,2-diacylglycerol 3-alpha-glucosyltransferase